MGIVNSSTRDFGIEVAELNLPGYDHFTVFGRNEQIDMANKETIWDVGGIVVFPTGGTLTIESDNTNDDFGGTGATTVIFTGLSATNIEQSEVVVLDGTTQVTTASSWNRVFRVQVIAAGATMENEGTIDIKDGITVVSRILPSMNATQNGFYRIPAGKIGYITDSVANIVPSNQAAGIKEGEIELKIRAASSVFLLVGSSPLSSRSGQVKLDFKVPEGLPALTDIKIDFVSNQNNSKVTIAFQIVLVDV